MREGLEEPPGGGGHDEPWLQTGALRDSVGAQADGLQATVGSSDPAAVPQELGTSRMPPRPFLLPVAASMGEAVARAVAAAVVAALRGDSPDAGNAHVDLYGDGPDGSDLLYGGAIAGGGVPASTNSAKAPGAGGHARSAAHRSSTGEFDTSGVQLASDSGTPPNPSSTPTSGILFATAQEAAINAIESINSKSIAENREYTGKIRIDPVTGMYYADPPIPGTETKAALVFTRKDDQLTVETIIHMEITLGMMHTETR